MVRKRLREEKTFKNEFDRPNALIEAMWHLFPAFLVRVPICWPYMPRSPDATIPILAWDLKPEGLTKPPSWPTFFRSRKVRNADSNLLFEGWSHPPKPRRVTPPKKIKNHRKSRIKVLPIPQHIGGPGLQTNSDISAINHNQRRCCDMSSKIHFNCKAYSRFLTYKKN